MWGSLSNFGYPSFLKKYVSPLQLASVVVLGSRSGNLVSFCRETNLVLFCLPFRKLVFLFSVNVCTRQASKWEALGSRAFVSCTKVEDIIFVDTSHVVWKGPWGAKRCVTFWFVFWSVCFKRFVGKLFVQVWHSWRCEGSLLGSNWGRFVIVNMCLRQTLKALMMCKLSKFVVQRSPPHESSQSVENEQDFASFCRVLGHRA